MCSTGLEKYLQKSKFIVIGRDDIRTNRIKQTGKFSSRKCEDRVGDSYLKPTWGLAKSLSCLRAGVSGYGVLISGLSFC